MGLSDPPCTVHSRATKFLSTYLANKMSNVFASLRRFQAEGSRSHTSGYGMVAAPLLVPGQVKTAANGQFSFGPATPYPFTCPSASTQVYLVGTGGQPIPGITNSNLALMAGLGNCRDITNSTFVSINELTTVATAYALQGFMSGIGSVSTSATNITGLANAVAAINQIVNTTTGNPSGPALPSGALLPIAEINTLGDILAACINSAGGVANDSSPCGTFFQLTKSPSTPSDTIGAVLNLARNPGRNVQALFNMLQAQAPFQTALSVTPNDFTLAI